jgi:hypothetical protein
MSEWWSVVVVFWALYLADGVSGGRRERLFLWAWRGRARLTQASWFCAPPAPWAYAAALDDLPASLAVEGLTNWPSAATSRPPPLPDELRAVKWEDVDGVKLSGGQLWLAGRAFAPSGVAWDAAGLRRLVEELKPVGAEARRGRIAAWHARRFSVTRARRRLRVALGRTRRLAIMNTLQTAGWALLSAALLSGWFTPSWEAGASVPWAGATAGALAWWGLLAWLLVSHAMVVYAAWSVHRRLYPAQGEARWNLVFGALLLPPQALRLRAALMRPLGAGLAPLAVVLAAGAPRVAKAAAEATWRDVIYPLRPERLPELIARLSDEATALARSAVERALAEATAAGAAGVRPEDLLAAPVRGRDGACGYCPRCGDTFMRAEGRCPQGVALRKVAGAEQALSLKYSDTPPGPAGEGETKLGRR